MSLFFIDDIEFDAPPDLPTEARAEFMAGVKAAFIVSQMNRLGQVLCGGCGVAKDDLTAAFTELELAPATVISGARYSGGLQWGDDHPSNLLLLCIGCLPLEE